MKRKKYAALILVLGMLLAGCGKAENNSNPTEQGTSNNGGPVTDGREIGDEDTDDWGTDSKDTDGLASSSLDPGPGNSPEAASGSTDKKDISWQAAYFPLENRYTLALAAEQLYGCYIKDGQAFLDRMDKDAGSACETLALPEVSLITGLAADGEGSVYLLGDREEGTGFWKMDAKGTLQDYGEMELEDTERADELRFKGIFTDSAGHLFVWCEMCVPEMELFEGHEREVWHYEDRIYVKDGQLNTLFFEKIADMRGTQVLTFQVGAQGEAFFVVKDSDGIYIQEIDVTAGGSKNAVRLEKSGDLFDVSGGGSPENIVPVAGGFLYCLNNELLEYHFDTQKVEKLLSLSTYGIFSEDILFLAKKQDHIEIIDNHGAAGHSEFISLSLGKTEKKIVTLGSTAMIPDLEKVVVEFNRYSRDYRVEIVDYIAQAGSYEDAVERLKVDVITGKAPDLFTTEGLDYSVFSDKGVLADLYAFMEADEECSRNMLVQSVLKACEDEGHLYSIAPAFLLHTMWGYGDVIRGKSGVTFEELFRLLEDSGKDINAITGFSADEPVLTRLCTVSMDEFVDWEKGTCSFDGGYFKRVLSFAKDYTGNDAGGTYSERIGRREAVMSVGLISKVSDYQIEKEVYGGDLDFIGYPVAEGSGTAAAFMGNEIAINAGKEDQIGAWEFVKYYLLHGYNGQGFPLLQEQLDEVLAAAMEEDYELAEDGGKERCSKGYYGDGVTSFSVYAAAKEDVDRITALIESVGNRAEYHTTIQNIINEEAQGYFSGQVDLDKTVEKIQNRVALFLQESQ